MSIAMGSRHAVDPGSDQPLLVLCGQVGQKKSFLTGRTALRDADVVGGNAILLNALNGHSMASIPVATCAAFASAGTAGPSPMKPRGGPTSAAA